MSAQQKTDMSSVDVRRMHPLAEVVVRSSRIPFLASTPYALLSAYSVISDLPSNAGVVVLVDPLSGEPARMMQGKWYALLPVAAVALLWLFVAVAEGLMLSPPLLRVPKGRHAGIFRLVFWTTMRCVAARASRRPPR